MTRKRPGRNWGKQIKSTKDVAGKKLKILLWGPPGTGKTHFLGSCPNPFVIASEDGVLTLHKHDIPYFKLDNSMAIYDTSLQIIESAIRREKVEIEDGKFVDFAEIETICLDSAWMLNSRLIREIKDESGKPKFQHDHWGLLLDRMQDIILKLVESDFHVVVTVGEAVKQDDMDEEAKQVTFNMQGSFRNQIAYIFDLNLSMTKESLGRQTSYKLFTNDENNRSAKSRVNGLPKEIKDPSFSKIFDPMMAELKG